MKITLFLLPLLTACGTETEPASTSFPMPAHQAVLEMFVMSQCPYGVEVVNAIAPVAKQLGGALDVQVHYIGDGKPGEFTSMHGPAEVRGDIAQLCVAEHAREKLFDVLVCQNQNPKAVDNNWKDCATSSGADLAPIEACVNGEEGQKLLAASFELAKSKGAKGSPTMFLDGQPYKGGRKTNDFLRSVCATYEGDAPPPCADIPVPPKVDAIFLTDARCKDESCNLAPLEPKLKGQLAGLDVKYLDWSDAEGKALYDQLKAADPSFKYLPVALLSKDVEKDADGYKAVQRFLVPLGEWQSLKIGAQFDPNAEICDNTSDDDADGLVDCLDDGCTASLVCRTEMPKKLDLFAMSHCPYGAKAMIAANELVQQHGDDVDVDVHFIGDEKDGKLTSMHGQPEVDDDIREICAAKKYPSDKQYMQFLACRSKDYKSEDWQACAKEAGMDAKVIQSCFDGEGQDLLRASFDQARALSISSSPTFLSNNRRMFNAVATPALQKQYCQDNPSLALCASTMMATESDAAPVPAGACK